jgi:glycolate oxidase iron-sulfur subunit
MAFPEPAFDGIHPPSAALLGDCVHCGFCLPTCPTYALWGEEMDSPRGRIYLMQLGLGGAPLSPTMVGHFDACLGCMACVTACPSGVRYDRLIDATRAQVQRRHRRPLPERLWRGAVFAVFPHPERLRALRAPLRLYRRSGAARLLRGRLERLSPRLAAMESIAPPAAVHDDVAAFTPAVGARRGTVGLLLGCVQREFFPGVNAATVRVLAAEGFDVVVAPGQGCCGALSVHNGRDAEARRFARALVDRLGADDVDHVVVNAAGCGSTVKDYGELLADDPLYAARARDLASRALDVTELLAAAGSVAVRHPLPVTVAYHDACHLAHAQGVRAQPRTLLSEIPGLELREIADAAICCGSAGIWNVLNPVPGRALGDRKAADVVATGAELLVTANPGCLMQVAAGLERAGAARIGLAHTVEVLDASIQARPVHTLLPTPASRSHP